MQQTPTEYMKQRELMVNLNVTHTLLVKMRWCGNCSDGCNFHWKQQLNKYNNPLSLNHHL